MTNRSDRPAPAPTAAERESLLDSLLAQCLKPEEIAGPQRMERIHELLLWFGRLAHGRANPKWLRAHAFELAYALASGEPERGDAFAPGDWICDTCGYIESRRVLHAHTGEVTASHVPAYPCPNDGQFMRRYTWREMAEAAQARALEEIEQREQAEAALAAASQGRARLHEQLSTLGERHRQLHALQSETARQLELARARVELEAHDVGRIAQGGWEHRSRHPGSTTAGNRAETRPPDEHPFPAPHVMPPEANP